MARACRYIVRACMARTVHDRLKRVPLGPKCGSCVINFVYLCVYGHVTACRGTVNEYMCVCLGVRFINRYPSQVRDVVEFSARAFRKLYVIFDCNTQNNATVGNKGLCQLFNPRLTN